MTVRPNVNHFLRANPRTAGAMSRFIGKVGTARPAPSPRRGGVRRPRPAMARLPIRTYSRHGANATNMKITEIRRVVETDDLRDLSWLGTTSSVPESNAINREDAGIEHGRIHHTEQYFNPVNSEYAMEDYKEWCSFGEKWGLYYLHADAIIEINGIRQTIQSQGVGNVAIEFGGSYDSVSDVWPTEEADLANHLRAMGFTMAEIRAAPVIPAKYY